MELRVLGPLEVVDDAGGSVDVRGDKPKGLVALLALRAGEVVSAGRIIDELWGEQEIRDPLNAVQVLVSKVRRALRSLDPSDGPLIETTSSGYRLAVGPEAVDAVRFARAVEKGRRLWDDGEMEAAAATLRDALSLWRGPALVDFDDDFARGDRTRLEELRAGALELRFDAELALGRHEEAAAELALLTSDHPLREKLRAQQMLALHRSGRQADALRAYQSIRSVLADELGLEPGPELRRLEAAILSRDPAIDLGVEPERQHAGRSATARTGNLPAPVSSFVGREEEIDAVVDLVGTHRLVTLVGPGGVGKTRLALEVAAATASEHRDGVWLVELASLRDPVNVGPAVATALGLDDAARLDRFLADKAVLLVMDNCEHVLEEAATVVARLVSAGENVRVLSTSREHLGVIGELLWRVPPLTASDSAALFVERAEAFGIDEVDDDMSVVERICDRLDGLPLAVELAAARTRSLSLVDIDSRIDDRFRLLTTGGRTADPRQQTLRGVVDWSYELLFTDEQKVFRRLSVFDGGFDLRAAESVAAGDDVSVGDVVDIVGRLVDKSLVSVVSRVDDTRYRLLQTLAEYGHLRLAEAGEEEDTRDRHLRWMVQLANEAEAGLRGFEQERWIRVLGLELDNARAALEWAVHRESAADAVALAGGMAYGWYITGAIQPGQAFILRALALERKSSGEQRAIAEAWVAWLIQIGAGATGEAVEHSERAVTTAQDQSAKAFSTAAIVASLLRAYRGLTVEAAELIEEAAARLLDAPDPWCQAFLDWVRSGLSLKVGDAPRATELLQSSIAGFTAVGDRYGRAIASIRLGELAEMRGDYEEAIAATTFAYEGTMSSGPGANASILATRLGNLAALQGRFDDALSWHTTALTRARELGFPGPAAQALSGMGVAASLQGSLEEARSRHEEALVAYESVGSVEGEAFTLACLGFLATNDGDRDDAVALFRRSLGKAVRGSERRATALAVEGLAGTEVLGGDGERAALLLGVAAALRGDGTLAAPRMREQVTQVEAFARGLIGDLAYETAHASGRRQADTIVARLAGEGAPT